MKTEIGEQVVTKDLWEASYMLACGCDLMDVELKEQYRKKEVFFILSGNNADELSMMFKAGHTNCDIGLLRSSMMHLKQEMFKLIRR